MQVCIYCLKLKLCLIRVCYYFDDDGEDDDGDEYYDEGIDELGDLVDFIIQFYYFYYFFQTIFFFVDNIFIDYGNREYLGQYQKQGQGARYSVNKFRINIRKQN